MNQKNIHKLITEALAIEAQEAKEAGALGFMARALTQATMPHKKTMEYAFERTNGAFTLSILAPPKIGLPYGTVPRLLMAWVTTEAVRKRERELLLGESLSGFMSELGLVPTGGRWGSITRLKEQMRRLFASSISCTYDDGDSWVLENIHVVDGARLWWSPKAPEQITIWQSTVTLSERFFDEVISHPIPIDMRAIKTLKRSPMALDIYCWLTYRMCYLRRETNIPWVALQTQFGAEYSRVRDFKKYFLLQLKKVEQVYQSARMESTERGLLLKPSRPHVQTLSPRSGLRINSRAPSG